MIDLQAIRTPIPGDNPAGVDPLSLSELDDIKEARRADDPTLAQGEWKSKLKEAEWPKVMDLAGKVLRTKAKDLQTAAWLAEAATMRYGFSGASSGLEVFAAVVADFWDQLYPSIDDGDLDARIARCEWLDKNLARALSAVPLTAPPAAYGLSTWRDALDMEEKVGKNPALLDELLASGRVSMQKFTEALGSTPAEHLLGARSDLSAARGAYDELRRVLDLRFGDKLSPRLRELGQTLDEVSRVLERLCAQKGLNTAGSSGSETGMGQAGDGSGRDAANVGQPAGFKAIPASSIDGKQAALAQLGQIAEFFRRTEPHSPASFLLAQAVRWANMPLDKWLSEVVKDDTTLARINEILGVKSQQQQ